MPALTMPMSSPALIGVIEKGRVHRLAHHVVAAEGKGDVADAAADPRPRQVVLDPLRGADEIDGVVVVLLDAGGHGQDVRIENDVLRREADFLRQDAVGALANSGSSRSRVSAWPRSSNAITTTAAP